MRIVELVRRIRLVVELLRSGLRWNDRAVLVLWIPLATALFRRVEEVIQLEMSLTFDKMGYENVMLGAHLRSLNTIKRAWSSCSIYHLPRHPSNHSSPSQTRSSSCRASRASSIEVCQACLGQSALPLGHQHNCLLHRHR